MTGRQGKATDNAGQEVEEFLRQAFEDNYERLRVENGRGLSADGRESAWNQVRLYWRKLGEVAQSITDTEVHLTLPNQETAKHRRYAIEGVVDIVREKGRTVMYDIKSHAAGYVRQHKEMYEKQLNVYAHIWQKLREQELDETAIIATDLPPDVAGALDSGDEKRLAYAMSKWDPIVPMDFDASRVEETVAEFGQVVDAIEDRRFTPPTVERLGQREGTTQQQFATAVCRNCDARFSCASYRQWALGSGSRAERAIRQYFGDLARDEELEAWRTANQDAMSSAADLAENYGR